VYAIRVRNKENGVRSTYVVMMERESVNVEGSGF